MAGYFIGIHRYFRMRKSLLATFSSAEFNTMSLNSKLYKVLSYIQDNKYLESILVFGFLVLQILTNQEWTTFSTFIEWCIYPWSNHHIILITKNYSQYLDHHTKRYGFHHTVITKRNIILIQMFQRVAIQICFR